MDESAAGSLIGIIMSPLVLLIVYATVKGAATGPVERNGMAGIRIKPPNAATPRGGPGTSPRCG